MKKKPEEEMS